MIWRHRAALALAVASSCAGIGWTRGATPPAAAAAAGSGVDKDDAANQALFEKTCSGCHALDQATGQTRDAADWSAILDRMAGYGAVLDADSYAHISHYLNAHYGAAKPPK